MYGGPVRTAHLVPQGRQVQYPAPTIKTTCDAEGNTSGGRGTQEHILGCLHLGSPNSKQDDGLHSLDGISRLQDEGDPTPKKIVCLDLQQMFYVLLYSTFWLIENTLNRIFEN